MTHRPQMTMILLVALVALSFGQVVSSAQTQSGSRAPAKPWTPPKTSDGYPDLQGTWTTTTTTPFERSPQYGNRLYMTDEELVESQRRLERQLVADGQETRATNVITTGPPDHWTERAKEASRQTSLVIEPANGRVPVTAAAEARRDFNAANVSEGFDYMSPWDRCITRGMPGGMFPGLYGNVYEIVQSPGYVAIVAEMIHETRVIPTDGRPFSKIRRWNGESIGRWDGNTLVVETRNYNNKGWIATNLAGGRIKGIGQSEDLHVVERFTRVDEATIQYEVTITDPQIYTAPWKVSFPFTKDPGAMIFEYACHEGNYSMRNMLSGARAQEKAAAEAARGVK